MDTLIWLILKEAPGFGRAIKRLLGVVADGITLLANKLPKHSDKVIGVTLIVGMLWLFLMAAMGVL